MPGCNSVAVIGGVTITATGGGRGGSTGDTAGDPGGSGGGGGFHDAGGPYPGSPGTCGQGNAGGASNNVASPGACGSGAGGGGGAGAVGGNAPASKPNNVAGIGGAGTDVSPVFGPTVGVSLVQSLEVVAVEQIFLHQQLQEELAVVVMAVTLQVE